MRDHRVRSKMAQSRSREGENSAPSACATCRSIKYGYVLTGEATFDPPTSPLDENGQGIPYAVYGFGAHMAEIEVDTELGTVRVLKITAAHDVGRAINPTLIEGQIEGGAAQGLGMALMEEFFPGKGENLHDYLIPSAGDMPPVESILIEDPSPIGPFGAKGIGEQAVIPTAPAILNAIHDAIGVRIHRIPATPDRVRAAILAKAQSADKETQRALKTTPSAAMPARCSATSSRDGRARAIVTRITTDNWCASIRTLCSIGRVARRFGGSVSGSRPRMGWQHREVRRNIRHRDRRGHNLSRLQARAFHHFLRGGRRGHGHGGHRGNFQLLRRQSEDRYRPPSRARRRNLVRAQGEAGGPRNHQRIRLADAFARRRAPPDRRQPQGRHA